MAIEMPAVHLPHETHAPADPGKSGEYYDRCPADGCIEVERSYKFGGIDNHDEEHLLWSMYSADRRKGGCGHGWARTTEQGKARDESRGVSPKWLTQSAAVGRAWSLPTPEYEANYEKAFGHK